MSIRHTSEEGVSDNNAVKLAKIQRESTISIPASKIQDLSDPAVITSAVNVGSNRPYNNGSAVVSFTPSATGGTTSGAQFTNFVATSTPGSITGTATTSPVTVTGLASATSYTFTVAGVNVSGTGISSAASSSVAITTVPQAPTAGTPSNVPSNRAYNNGRIDVPVTANASGGSAVISYLVTSSPGSFTGTGTSSPISVTGLASNTAYTFTAQAVNANGTSLASTASTSATATTVPEAPTLGTPTDVGTNRPYNNGAVSIPVTGGATGGSAITAYTSTSTPGGLITSNAGTTPLIATGLTVGTTYGFTVTATNANGVSTGTVTGTNVVPTSVPQTPTLGTVTTSGGSVYVPFTAGGTGGKAITSYTIVSSPALTLTYSGTTSPITVTAAYVQGQAYTFTLTAVNANGSSITTAASNAVTPLATITDNFNRTGSSLGITSSGTTWSTPAGSWSTNGSSVQAGSDNSLGSVAFGNNVATVTADAGTSSMAGYGVAYWVSSASSYYYSYYQTYTYSYTYNSGPAYCTDCVTYSCNNVTSTSTYAATPTTTYGSYTYTGAATTYVSSVYARKCTAADVANPSSPCTTTNDCDQDAGGAVCLTWCPDGGTTSSNTGGTCYFCAAPSVNGPNPSTGSGSVASCYTQSSTTTYSCPSGGTLSGTTCTVTSSVSGGTWPSCSGTVSTTTSTCPNTPAQGCGGCTTNGGGGAYVQPTATASATGHLVRTGGPGLSGISSSDLGQSVSKITLVTSSGSSVTVFAYNSAGTQVYASGSITPTATPTKVGNYGIFRGNSTTYTGIDNFSVS